MKLKFLNLIGKKNQKKSINNTDKEFELINNQSDIVKIQQYIRKNFLQIKKSNSDYELGYYYQFTKNDYEQMKKYYDISINNQNPNANAMTNLGYYYQFNIKDYVHMKKYYLMAIEFGETNAMFNLGHYYTSTEFNSELSKKYLDMFYIIKKFKDRL